MADNITAEELREKLQQLDAEIAELRGGTGSPDNGAGVRDPEEIANDLTSREEQQAVLGILQRRRETILERLKSLGG
jgi:hypothetical protein